MNARPCLTLKRRCALALLHSSLTSPRPKFTRTLGFSFCPIPPLGPRLCKPDNVTNPLFLVNDIRSVSQCLAPTFGREAIILPDQIRSPRASSHHIASSIQPPRPCLCSKQTLSGGYEYKWPLVETEVGPSSIRRTLEPFQRQRWRNS